MRKCKAPTHPVVAVKAKGMANNVCAGKCLSHSSDTLLNSTGYQPDACIASIHFRSAANAKSPQRSDRGQKSLANKEAAYVRLLGPGYQHCPTIAPQARSHREPFLSSSPYAYGSILQVLSVYAGRVTSSAVASSLPGNIKDNHVLCGGWCLWALGVSHGQQLV